MTVVMMTPLERTHATCRNVPLVDRLQRYALLFWLHVAQERRHRAVDPFDCQSYRTVSVWALKDLLHSGYDAKDSLRIWHRAIGRG